MKKVLLELTPPIIKRGIKKILGIKEPMPEYIDESVGSYSQYHDDLIIDALLSCRNKGFYVDIGCPPQ